MADDGSDDLAGARRRRQAAWIADIAAGGARREEALRRLADEWDGRVLRWCRHELGLSPEDAEDVWQETLIGICRGAHTFRPDGNPAAWILGIVRHRAIDLFRRPYRHREVGTLDGPAAEAGAPSTLARDECVRRALRVFAEAQPDDLRTLLLREIEGWDIPELAVFLQRAETATRQVLSRIRRQIAPLLEPCLGLVHP